MVEDVFFSFDEILAKMPASILWFIFFIFIILALIVGLALMFHWKKYKLYSPSIDATQIIYFVGLFILFILSGTSLIFFNSQ